MYPKKTNDYKPSYFDLFIDFKDFIVDSAKSFKNPKRLIIFLHKNFHF